MEVTNILASIFSGVVALIMGFFCWLVHKLYERQEKDITQVSDKCDVLTEKVGALMVRVETAYNLFENEKDDLEETTKMFKDEIRDIKTLLNIALLDKTQIQRQLDELWERK